MMPFRRCWTTNLVISDQWPYWVGPTGVAVQQNLESTMLATLYRLEILTAIHIHSPSVVATFSGFIKIRATSTILATFPVVKDITYAAEKS